MLSSPFHVSPSKLLSGLLVAFIAITHPGQSQTRTLPLKDLSSFQNPSKSWQIAGSVAADLGVNNKLTTGGGEGVLVNNPSPSNPGKDLLTNFEHGDADVELDFLMAKGSNSGIYLQGLYELQLVDSWGHTDLTSASLGGMYERWDDSRPEGQKGYQGYAPRQSVGRAPGLWQHLKIVFQAPRFDGSGKKTENARILRAELNGVTIHENVELFGPTGGALSAIEKPTGPLRLQGDHGPVAFRNIKINQYSKPRPELKKLSYKVYKGKYTQEPAYANLPPEAAGPAGTSEILSSNLGIKETLFLIQYKGTLVVKEPGEYTFNQNTNGGAGLLRVNNKDVIPLRSRNGKGAITLPTGEVPFEFLYSKSEDWGQPQFTLQVVGPGIREFLLSEVVLPEEVDPILVDVKERPVLRSFIDLPRYRVTHAVSVGSPTQLHYIYDMDFGTMVQMWRGGFLDATPMWHERGDGSSRAIGSVQRFGKPTLTLAKLSSEDAAWASDTAGTGFRQKGYSLSKNSEPTFHYLIHGATVKDGFKVFENGKGLQRELNVHNAPANLYARLVDGAKIEEMGQGLYMVDDKAYYLRLDDPAGAKPILRKIGNRQELLVPVRNKIVYTLLF